MVLVAIRLLRFLRVVSSSFVGAALLHHWGEGGLVDSVNWRFQIIIDGSGRDNETKAPDFFFKKDVS